VAAERTFIAPLPARVYAILPSRKGREVNYSAKLFPYKINSSFFKLKQVKDKVILLPN